jgi:hypothetical protein
MEEQSLNNFYTQLISEIRTSQLSEEYGASMEQLFTAHAIDLLTGGGETADVRVAYHESLVPRKRHKINAFAIPDHYETLDLFVTIFKCTAEASRLSKAEINDTAQLVVNFLAKSSSAAYTRELEESSEIFDFARTISDSAELSENLVRVNVFILSDGRYQGEIPQSRDLNGTPVFFRVIDLDYLHNISEKSYIPIEIDFEAGNFVLPCISAEIENSDYQSYLALIPAGALVAIYERYGARLLEQNVRSFLQFTGKINKGIRNTILKSPHMFLAFNNGIAATAGELALKKSDSGYVIGSVKDLQIVNGGQTIASVYHTWKKDRADISKILIQLKLSVIKDKTNFNEIVGKIAEYANTQNTVSASDLSSNSPFHIEMEKLSRSIWAPPAVHPVQTQWFYERARGQYKNARIKQGTNKTKLKAFDAQNPKKQFFTKEELAKFINCFTEIYKDEKLLIGPHIVVRGSQKNYAQFIANCLPENTDESYYIDLIAKGIIFRTAEKEYGVKPNSIGDMRYITVPYTLAWIAKNLASEIDLRQIWRFQSLNEQFKKTLYALMVQVEAFIKDRAPGSRDS